MKNDTVIKVFQCSEIDVLVVVSNSNTTGLWMRQYATLFSHHFHFVRTSLNVANVVILILLASHY